ncbi:hypothetical protein BGZ67_009093 [Mortierella alpina]|nr:hypothetical protein BGZ67_009093 [Mortierella alpina]
MPRAHMTNSRRVAIVTGASRVDEIAVLRSTQYNKNHAQVRAIAVQADASKTADSKRLLDETIAAFGRIDVLVLNAAFFGGGSIRDVTKESFPAAIDANVKSPLFFSKLAQPYLEKA